MKDCCMQYKQMIKTNDKTTREKQTSNKGTYSCQLLESSQLVFPLLQLFSCLNIADNNKKRRQ